MRPTRLDVLLALAVAGAGVVEAYGRSGPGPGQVHSPAVVAAGALAAGGLLLLRRTAPVAALLALTALSALLRLTVMDDDYPLAAWQFYSNLILVHGIGSAHKKFGGLLAVLAVYGLLQTLPGRDFAESLIGAIFIGVAYGSGILLRRQTERTVRMAERAAVAAAEERTRIARELHDVISHHVGLMTLQTGGVRLLLGADPARERERELLRGVERAGRDTVEELRLLLGVLRDTPDAAGVGRLDRLAGPLREAGLDVRVETAGEPRPLPAGLDLAAYRVVQESLTNVLKHARATAVRVVIRYDSRSMVVDVRDDGRAGGQDGSGHGLTGMRERVALHGGTLSAGPAPGGGYAVTATFPL
ncbi:sensor histidine kinase [Dactylosporangium sp. AC04546]|uniref:sensor histidine kinase n=1 Tax=Dactylosporangium sp. AC04546 TaxID=2862460 RepID=UPI001EDE5989|nr:sensor histidine kinase [Dactylosporangium sp. AC04546]WVK79975.1 sensor histidine kinase [Dactylosporangium sp. AC04546]